MKKMNVLSQALICLLLMWLGGSNALMANTTTKVESVQQSGQVVTVTGTGVRLRYGPGLNYDFLKWKDGTARCPKKGEKLQLIGQSGDWYQVRYAGQDLYIFKQYGSVGKGAVAAAAKSYVKITGKGVRLRFGPGLDYGYLVWKDGTTRSPKVGEKLVLLGQEGDWYKVQYQDAEFYVFKQYAQKVK